MGRLLGLHLLGLQLGLATLGQAAPPPPTPPAGELGNPFLRSFGQDDYTSHPQNWAIAQDARGVLYFGNTDGVLEFDGDHWRRTRTDRGSIVRSLALGPDGHIYVGAVGELGWLRPEPSGTHVYRSLLDALPEEDRPPADVWRTLATSRAVYFWFPGKLLRWQDDRFQSWEIDSQLVPAVVDDRLLINLRGRGLVTLDPALDPDELVAVPGGEALADLRVDLLLPTDDHTLLVGSRDGRLFLFDPSPTTTDPSARLRRLPTEADDHLASHQLYTGTRLADGTYALATMTGGLVVLDGAGRLRHRVGRTQGLPDNAVWATFVDHEGGLWLGLNRGIARLDIGAPITVFPETSGLEGTVEALTRHQGKLHAGTSAGVFRLDDGTFHPIGQDLGLCWSLASLDTPTGPTLLAGTYSGVFEVDDAGTHRRLDVGNAFALYNSPSHPQRVLVGHVLGVSILEHSATDWEPGRTLLELETEVRSLSEDDQGNVWLGTAVDGLYRLQLDEQGALVPGSLRHFGPEDGLPGTFQLKPIWTRDGLLVATPQGLFGFDPSQRRFVASTLFGHALEPELGNINRLVPDAEGNLWFALVSEQSPALATRSADGSFALRSLPFRGVSENIWFALLPEAEGIAWFGGPDGLYRFDRSVAERVPTPTRTLLRQVSRRDGSQLPLPVTSLETFGPPSEDAPDLGAADQDLALDPACRDDLPTLDFEGNDLTFHYAMTNYGNGGRRQYRYQLIGFDDAWSPWTVDTKVELRNLPEGTYTFRVQGRDANHRLAQVASYPFRITPPWFRSQPFRLVLLVGLGLVLWGGQRGLVARIRNTQRTLAEREQTAERERLIARLQSKNEDLQRFSYTVSHDLKAPLVTIRGFLGYLARDLAEGKTDRLERDLERIDSAAAKMQGRVERILQLSRIGHKVSAVETVPMADMVAEALELVSGELRDRGVTVQVANDLPSVVCDRGRIVEALQNLLQNAVKYLGDQPEPKISFGVRRDGPAPVFTVRDNGIGVAPEHHERIFGLFERLDDTVEGTGVGLSLVRGTLEAHDGHVWVESEGPGQGSTFCFTFADAVGGAIDGLLPPDVPVGPSGTSPVAPPTDVPG